MITNSFIERMGDAYGDQGAAEIQPIFLIPSQRRSEIQLGIFERSVEERVSSTADDGEDSNDSPSQHQPLHSRGFDSLTTLKSTHWLLRASKKHRTHSLLK